MNIELFNYIKNNLEKEGYPVCDKSIMKIYNNKVNIKGPKTTKIPKTKELSLSPTENAKKAYKIPKGIPQKTLRTLKIVEL